MKGDAENMKHHRTIWVNVTADMIVSTKPVRIFSILLTPAAGNADITLYDGESITDPEISCVRTLQHLSFLFNLEPGLVTRRGLFVDIGATVDNVLIQYEQLDS